MHDFKRFIFWKKSRNLVKEIYLLTKNYPIDEKFGLISQMRRSAISIVSNIAEGCGRYSKKEFIHFLNITIGSLCELESQLILSFDLSLIDKDQLDSNSERIIEIRKMIFVFNNKLKSEI